MTTHTDRVDVRRRAAAIAALVALGGAVVAVLVALRDDVGRLLVGIALLLVLVMAGWFAATRRGIRRTIGLVAAAASAVGFVIVVLTGEQNGLWLVPIAALVAASVAATRYALRRDRASLRQAAVPGDPVGPARKPVLIMNPKSGGGKATKFALADECRRRGIEPIVLEPGSDLLQLARDAIAGGADVVGMAGGDGSQALVASVCTEHDVALVCIPAGTRNHFALDLGLDRDDVVGALDAFGDAVERRIDLATCGGRVFVNNVSLGVYAKVVQSPEYRDAKRQTTANLLPEMLGPDAEKFDLRFTGPDGRPHDSAQVIQVSNNPYVFAGIGAFGTRPRLDTGNLAIYAIEIHNAADAARLVADQAAGRIERFPGFTGWNAPTFTVESSQPIEAGVDGEALVFDSPLEFRLLPSVLRVRVPTHAFGYSPAALVSPSTWWTLRALLRTVAGRPTPIDEAQR